MVMNKETANDIPAAERKISSIEDARLLIMKMNGLPVPESDPLMMLVSLMIAFADDYDAMLARHNKAITATMKGVISNAREGFEKEIQEFGNQVRSTTMQNVVLLISEHNKQMSEHLQATRQLTHKIMAASALFVVAITVVALWKVFS